MAVETNARKIIARLKRDGWVDAGGAKHSKFVHPDRPSERIMEPRHSELKKGLAAAIARQAGWIETE